MCFVFLLQRGRDFDPSRGALGAYLFGVARNYVRRALERNYSEAMLHSPADDEAQSLVTEDDPAERHRTASDFDRALEGCAFAARALSRGGSALRFAGTELCAGGGSTRMCNRHHSFPPAPGARHAGEEAATLGGRCARRSLKSYGEVCIMTCREFKHTAASLTLWELSRSRDEQVLDHADECPKCGAWLDRQQMLAATMQTLQARTAGREAGPHVERALLRMFRQVPFEAAQPVAAHRSTPIALRLSRFFELGAYVGRGGSHRRGTVPGSSAAGAAFRDRSSAEPVRFGERGAGTADAAAEKLRMKKIAPTTQEHPDTRLSVSLLFSLSPESGSAEAAQVLRSRFADQRRPGLCRLDVLRSAELFE